MIWKAGNVCRRWGTSILKGGCGTEWLRDCFVVGRVFQRGFSIYPVSPKLLP